MFNNIVTHHILRHNELPPYNALGYQYLLAGNGVFIRTNGRFFSAVVPVTRCTIRGLPPLEPQFHLHVPRLPEALLQSVLADAQQAYTTTNNATLHETLYHFHHLGHAVQVKKQTQQATPTRVQTAGDGGTNVICDLHSHGHMPPFWSGTDDEDEQGARLYAVIGRVDRERPEICLRVGVYGHWLPLPVTAVFNGNGDFVDLYHKAREK